MSSLSATVTRVLRFQSVKFYLSCGFSSYTWEQIKLDAWWPSHYERPSRQVYLAYFSNSITLNISRYDSSRQLTSPKQSALSSTNSVNVNSKVLEYLGKLALVPPSESGGGGGRDESGEGRPEALLWGRVHLLDDYLVHHRHILALNAQLVMWSWAML